MVLVPSQRSAYIAAVRTTEGKSPPHKAVTPANVGTPRSLTTTATTPTRETAARQSVHPAGLA